MKYILFLSIAFILSCQKSENDCKYYSMYIESTEESAKAKCRGLANNHPEWKLIEFRQIGCLTEDQIFIAKATGRNVIQQYCPGVIFEIRTIIK